MKTVLTITVVGVSMIVGAQASITGVSVSGNIQPAVLAPTPLGEDVLSFTDRLHQYNVVPPTLVGAEYIKPGNDDKNSVAYELTFQITTPSTLYLFLDNRLGDGIGGIDPASGLDDPPTLGGGVMDWVGSMGFADTGLDIGIDELGDGDIDNTSSIYSLAVNPGIFTLYEQANSNLRNMYGVAAVPVIPESSGAWGVLGLFGLGVLGDIYRRRR